ncbi:MAG: hypothetical protein OXF98_07105, partial [Rhodospirillaceae bacterium]|nr:hypothetical protein [Rhodospirillaceae bacterium]
MLEAVLRHLSQLLDAGILVALALAVYQLHQARGTSRNLKKISESISTQYVGEFPDHIYEIVRTLETAKKNVTILCDIPGYGHFSSPHLYRRYRSAIERLAQQNVEISITVYTRKYSRTSNEKQFGHSFKAITENEAFSNYIKRARQAPQSIEEFYDMLDMNYDHHYNDFSLPSISLVQTTERVPLYFWMVDDLVALFAFPSLSIDPPEVAFKTFDSVLIRIFKTVLQDIHRGVPAQHSPGAGEQRQQPPVV